MLPMTWMHTLKRYNEFGCIMFRLAFVCEFSSKLVFNLYFMFVNNKMSGHFLIVVYYGYVE